MRFWSNQIVFGFLIMVLAFPVFAQHSKKQLRAEAEDLVKQGVALNNNSRNEIDLYQKALDKDPSYPPVYYNLGNVYFDLKDYDKAIFFYKTACELKPSDRDYWYNLAFAYFKKRDYVLSIDSINHIIRMDKEKKEKDYEAVYLLAKIYARTQSQTTLNASRLLLLEILRESFQPDLRERSERLLKFLNEKLKIK